MNDGGVPPVARRLAFSRRLTLTAGLVMGALAAPAQADPGDMPADGPATPPVRLAQASPAVSQAASRPQWGELNASQREALAPLSAQWHTLSEPHKRKWIALAANFHRWPAAEQAKLHSRMTEWIALSPQERVRARLAFGEAQQLSPDAKKAKWEAYQALPPEERQRLAASAVPRPPSAAAAARPVPADKLASVPRTPPALPATAAATAKPPRIVVAPPVAAEPAAATTTTQ
jgi:hypothetical protein